MSPPVILLRHRAAQARLASEQSERRALALAQTALSDQRRRVSRRPWGRVLLTAGAIAALLLAITI